MNVFKMIISYSHSTPYNSAIEVLNDRLFVERIVNYRQLFNGVVTVEKQLNAIDKGQVTGKKYGLLMNNSPEWVACDLALGLSNRVEVPVPTIFGAEQAKNLLMDVDICLVDARGAELLECWQRQWSMDKQISVLRIDENVIFANTPSSEAELSEYLQKSEGDNPLCKVIHTSGTTNAPKGVKISLTALGQQVSSLRECLGDRNLSSYVSVMPLSLLIEQICAIYLFMSYGGTLTVLSPNIPLLGASKAVPSGFLPFYSSASPDFMVAPPSVVEALYSVAKNNPNDGRETLCKKLFGKNHAPFIACGNAPISPAILMHMHERGIAVMEGYGLSENTSVVSWNTLAHFRYGTVGRPLNHVKVKLDKHHQLLIKSKSMYLGYTREDPSSCQIDADGWLHTGDIAEIDNDGYIKIKGRKKHVLITSSGRNISPEWVESKYKQLGVIRNVIAYGDGLPNLVGIFVVNELSEGETQLRKKIDAFGRDNFSDIERISDYIILEASEDLYENYFNITGDPMRTKLWDLYKRQAAIAV